MAEELELDLDSELDQNETVDKRLFIKRVKELSEKNKLTLQEKEELAKSEQKLKADLGTTTKERDFYASFADSASQYPQAREFKEKIKEKVMSGYTVEDATVSILAKEGKLTTSAAPRENPAGGSASTALPASGTKSVHEMTREEKRAALMDAQAKGDISVS